MPVKETGGPRVTGAVGIDQVGDHHWGNATEDVTVRQPRAVLAHFHRREDAEAGEPAGERGVVRIAVLKQGADLVFVRKHDVDAAP